MWFKNDQINEIIFFFLLLRSCTLAGALVVFFPQVFNINNLFFYTLQLQNGLNDFKVVKYEQLGFSQQVKTMRKKKTLKSVCLDVTKIVRTLFITACIWFFFGF